MLWLIYIAMGIIWLSFLGVVSGNDFGVAWIKNHMVNPTNLKVLFTTMVLVIIWCPLVVIICLDSIFE